MKNLLHLGEDRYLTTLLLKHFPLFKTQFVRDAHAYTVAPDDWKVLLSQRRRWINSTVHNLGELVFLEQLCGFCCFSMRFIVMIDLVSTIIQPVSVAYVSSFIDTPPHFYLFSSPCRLYIYSISSSDKANLSLRCH
jgi:chitin synthase